MRTEGNGVYAESRKFLGTGFFVTKRGDAITAAHVLQEQEDLPPGYRLVAVIFVDGIETVCWVTRSLKFSELDLALFYVNLSETKYLPVDFPAILPGTDFQLIGIPSHEVTGNGKEMRILKGHVTLVSNRLELSIPVPAGMSGSPLFVDKKVIGYAVGLVRSEELEEATEIIEEMSNTREVIRITEIRRCTYYGIGYAFHRISTHVESALGNMTLPKFIEMRNNDL
jgi:Trypsin-like peptidase domain